MSLLAVYLLLFVLALINFSVGVVKLKSFQSQYSSIKYKGDLENFKSMARGQMYIALLQFVFLSAALVLGIYGLLKGELSLLVILFMNGIILILGKLCKRIEDNVRSLPVDDERFQAEYRDICSTWLHKPFPDF